MSATAATNPDGFRRVTDAQHGSIHATVRDGVVVGIQFDEGYEDEAEAIVAELVGPVSDECLFTPVDTGRRRRSGRRVA